MINEQSAEVPEVVRASWEALSHAFAPSDPVMLRHLAVVSAWLYGQPLSQPSEAGANRVAAEQSGAVEEPSL